MNKALSSVAGVCALLLASAAVFGADPVDATFTDAAGKPVKLSDYRGKKAVVLLFMRGFTGDFSCYYCGLQTREYKANYDKVKDAGAEVLMVLPGAKDVKGYLEHVGTADEGHPEPDFSVPYPVVCDPDLSACMIFKVPAEATEPGGDFPVSEPATIVVGKDGTILYQYHGKKPGDRPSAETILAALKGGKPPAPDSGSPPAPAATPKPSFVWMSYDEGMKAAQAEKKPVLLEFYADW